jgi:hypothetical protein
VSETQPRAQGESSKRNLANSKGTAMTKKDDHVEKTGDHAEQERAIAMANKSKSTKTETVTGQAKGAEPMSKEAKKTTKLEVVKSPPLEIVKPVEDASDIESLWMDSKLGDGITNVYRHVVPIGKPRDFFRTHPLESYRRRTEVYTHKVEGEIEETHYIIGPALWGQIEEARPCLLVCVVDREGEPRLWPVKFPREGEKDNDAWKSARIACRKAIDNWTKIVWSKRSYVTREAEEGYAPTPNFGKLPPYNELIAHAFGESCIIRNTNHKMYLALMGKKPTEAGGDDGDLI